VLTSITWNCHPTNLFVSTGGKNFLLVSVNGFSCGVSCRWFSSAYTLPLLEDMKSLSVPVEQEEEERKEERLKMSFSSWQE